MSPLSVQTALTMLMMGANGETYTDLESALQLGTTPKVKVSTEFNSMLRHLQQGTGVELANAIYLMQGYQVQPSYQSIVTKQFYSVIQPLNFANNVQSANTINAWVSQQTHDKINNLIAPDMLSPLTRLVLVNAIYFNGTWLHPFSSVNADGQFYTNGCDKSSTKTSMMHLTVSLMRDRFQIVELIHKFSLF